MIALKSQWKLYNQLATKFDLVMMVFHKFVTDQSVTLKCLTISITVIHCLLSVTNQKAILVNSTIWIVVWRSKLVIKINCLVSSLNGYCEENSHFINSQFYGYQCCDKILTTWFKICNYMFHRQKYFRCHNFQLQHVIEEC